VETTEPVITQQALQRGFSNEQGATGSVLLLRNVAGLWLLQECMRQWQLQGHTYNWGELLGMAERAESFSSLIDPDAADFVAPSDMLTAICRFCRRTRQAEPENPPAFARCLMESLSLRYREVVESLEEVTDRKLSTIRIAGGGSQNRLLCQLTADVTRRVVIAGPVEASALGNIMIQAIATGSISNASEGHEVIAASIQQLVFESRRCPACEDAYHRFRELCKCVSHL
jgi:rhamnulokinase